MTFDTGLILVSIATLGLYNVLVKEFPHKLVLLFLLNVTAYLGFLVVYFVHTRLLGHDARALRELVDVYIYQDTPLYAVIALCFLGSMIVSEKLLDGYDLSLVVPISQFGVLLSSAAYLVLGDPFKWTLAVGMLILCLGTVCVSLSAAEGAPSDTLLARLQRVPHRLWLLVLIQAVFFTVVSVLGYLGTKRTAETQAALRWLRRLHIGPLAFHQAFYFNLGQQCFSVVLFLVYLLCRRRYRTELVPSLTGRTGYLTLVVLAYFVAQYTYLIAFSMTTDTTILLGLDNLSTPVVLALSYLLLHEPLTPSKTIGSSLIVFGGVIAAL
jgi:drug/metabolite transporter (DMT)-like permease